MLHLVMRKGPWFRPKRHGYGAGLPILWEGWFFLALHMAMIGGVAVLLHGRPAAMAIAVILASLAPIPLYRTKTEGRWRWR